MSKFTRSSKSNPCPVCDRIKDRDCAFNDEVVLCHGYIDIDAEHPDYIYRGDRDGVWGIYFPKGKERDLDFKLPRVPAKAQKANLNPKPTRDANRTEYIYKDERGYLIAKVTRSDDGKGGRNWSQYHMAQGYKWRLGMPDEIRSRIHLYRIFDSINRKAIAEKTPILFVEGEGKADLLISMGVPATSCIGGATKWNQYGYPNYLEDLKDANLILVPDRDAPGVAHCEMVAKDFPSAKWLYPFPQSPEWDDLPPNKGWDIRDWIDKGATQEDLWNAIGEKRPTKAAIKKVEQPKKAREPKAKEPKVIELLRDIAKDTDCYQTDDKKLYADVLIEGTRHSLPLDGEDIKLWMFGELDLRYQISCGADTVQSVLNSLKARAKRNKNQREIYLRVGEHRGKYYLDLGNENLDVVEIDSSGWRLTKDCPIRFRRPETLKALPVPKCGGQIDELKQLLNLDDRGWQLAVSWLLFSLCGDRKVDYPVLILHGEQGSGKTFVANTLKELIDPGVAPLLPGIADTRNLAVAANNRWAVVYDNLSTVTPEQSDLLCRISTGGGFSHRTLNTDTGETTLDYKRPQILTGIDSLASRGDLMQRSILIECPYLDDRDRKPKSELIDLLQERKPFLLGAMLTAFANAIANIDCVSPFEYSRMSDFCKFGIALEDSLSLPSDSFSDCLTANRDNAVSTVVESNPIGKAIVSFMQNRQSWEGTPSELLELLSYEAPPELVKSKYWVKDATRLSQKLNLLKTDLRELGYQVETIRNKISRKISITHEVAKSASSASSASSDPRKPLSERDSKMTLPMTLEAKTHDASVISVIFDDADENPITIDDASATLGDASMTLASPSASSEVSHTWQGFQSVDDADDADDAKKATSRENENYAIAPKYKEFQIVYNSGYKIEETIRSSEYIDEEGWVYSFIGRKYKLKEEFLTLDFPHKAKNTANAPKFALGEIVVDRETGKQVTVLNSTAHRDSWSYTCKGGKRLYAESDLMELNVNYEL